jgi:hypothetical protein
MCTRATGRPTSAPTRCCASSSHDAAPRSQSRFFHFHPLSTKSHSEPTLRRGIAGVPARTPAASRCARGAGLTRAEGASAGAAGHVRVLERRHVHRAMEGRHAARVGEARVGGREHVRGRVAKRQHLAGDQGAGEARGGTARERAVVPALRGAPWTRGAAGGRRRAAIPPPPPRSY